MFVPNKKNEGATTSQTVATKAEPKTAVKAETKVEAKAEAKPATATKTTTTKVTATKAETKPAVTEPKKVEEKKEVSIAVPAYTEEEMKKLSFRTRKMLLSSELKAPKGQYNSFGKYAYRSAEDILEALKPLLLKYYMTLEVNDKIEVKGTVTERFYVKATAILSDTLSTEVITNSASARESDSKSGMDASQITGATSSYARKYALNGLFGIDDTKDADTEAFQSAGKK
ncbi:MAG: ERF family protein [Solobacterium sp.]|nr:ERF family protein [Solobacterium sp.]